MSYWKKQKISAAIFSLLLGLGLTGGEKAVASKFAVNPVRVSLSAKVSSQILTVENQSEQTLRFQVKVYSWNQDIQGNLQLTETQDIVAFPLLFSLNPGEIRRLRVGTLIPISSSEKTYRISINELPDETNLAGQAAVKILTNIGIPIFLLPTKEVLTGNIANILVSNHHISFQIKNTGNTHFIANNVHIQALGEANKTIFDRQRTGWYILSGTSQLYDLEISPQECRQTQNLIIEVKTENKIFTEKQEIPKDACQ